ncbi:MAG: 3-phosphoshikimate 1-carboxyvinyltransferase [Alphaproteobacteria bacterium ADurb.Bin438]|nr:MAG: 3-phosphoshikimate 1-carboxyvinyltransferase [Alphaproteobacteria bacterium ADurb.Bin438]
MMTAPYFEKATEIAVKDVKPDEESYIMMTYQMMKDFGAKITFNKQNSSFIVMPEKYKARDFTIEADFNTANYFFTLAAVTGSEIKVTNVDGATLQPGIIFLEVLKEMGAEVEITDKFIRVKGPEKLKGGFSVDMKKIAEMALNVAAIAPFADDEITMTNLEHIRGHECDRLKAMSENLTALGIKNKEHKDGITIYPGVPQNVVLDTFEDHRVAMSFALTGIAGNGLTLKDPDCVSKTCPTYFNILRSIGVDCEDIEI